MNPFNVSAQSWDDNPMHWERSAAIAEKIKTHIDLAPSMEALDFGAGTGILSFILKDSLKRIVMMDNSAGMVEEMVKKTRIHNVSNLDPLLFDLEQQEYKDDSFDLIFTQMVLHHLNDFPKILMKLFKMLRPNGYLAVVDLYPEDGSFHGEGFSGHLGFDADKLCQTLNQIGFIEISQEQCFTVKKERENLMKEYPLFILTAKK